MFNCPELLQHLQDGHFIPLSSAVMQSHTEGSQLRAINKSATVQVVKNWNCGHTWQTETQTETETETERASLVTEGAWSWNSWSHSWRFYFQCRSTLGTTGNYIHASKFVWTSNHTWILRAAHLTLWNMCKSIWCHSGSTKRAFSSSSYCHECHHQHSALLIRCQRT